MNFDQFESLWNTQSPAAAAGAAPAALAEHARRLAPELRRRSRVIGYGIFALSLALVLTPLLAVINSLHRAPANPEFYWLRAVLCTVATAALLAGAIRRHRHHRALAESRADTLAASAAKALAVVEGEMQESRLAVRLAPWLFALVLLSIQANVPVATHGWVPFGARAGLTLALCVLGGAVGWRHYHQILAPERARRQQVLEELS